MSSLNALQDSYPSPSVIAFNRDTDMYLTVSDPKATENQVLEFESRIRDRILDKFPSQNEGIDTERVSSYFKKLGLPVGKFVLIHESQHSAMIDELACGGISARVDAGGTALPVLGLAFVLRQPVIEAQNSTLFTEAVLVHELAHLTGQSYITVAQNKYGINMEGTRGGFGMPFIKNEAGEATGIGSFFEEAFAAQLQYDYLVNEAGLPEGLGTVGTFNVDSYDIRIATDIPSKYLHKNGDKFDASIPSIAAATIEKIEEQYPGTVDLMLSARSDITSIRKFIQVINSIRPGLYRELRQLQYTLEDFARGYTVVSKILSEK